MEVNFFLYIKKDVGQAHECPTKSFPHHERRNPKPISQSSPRKLPSSSDLADCHFLNSSTSFSPSFSTRDVALKLQITLSPLLASLFFCLHSFGFNPFRRFLYPHYLLFGFNYAFDSIEELELV